MCYQLEEKLIWKVDLNTVFPYIIATFGDGRLLIRIKKGEEPGEPRQAAASRPGAGGREAAGAALGPARREALRC